MKRKVFLIFFLILILGWASFFNSFNLVAQETSITINGRGYGHGVGLCMAGAKGMAEAGYNYKDILRKYYTGILFSKVDETQTIRVGILGTNDPIQVIGNGSYSIYELEPSGKRLIGRGGLNEITTFFYTSGIYYISLPDGKTLDTSYGLRVEPKLGNSIKVRNLSLNYYGNLEILFSQSSQKLWAINELPLNQYLYGIAEEPESWPKESLKALAVAARTYAIEKKLNPSSRHKKDGFDVCSTSDCQYYVGVRNAPNFKVAVNSTAGEIMVSDDKPILAAYFSCCGGETENNENVWGGSALSYLRRVTDEYCSSSSYYSWSVSYSPDELKAKLDTNPKTSVPGNLIGFQIIKIGASPRVISLKIVGDRGTKEVSGEDFKRVLGLRSTWFSFRPCIRLSGQNRYGTAVEVSRQGWESSDFVFIATGENFPDALTGSTLSFKYNAPFLLSRAQDLPEETLSEINRLQPHTVIILGGKGAISEGVELKLKSKGMLVRRIGGKDRYETASLVARDLSSKTNLAFIASGENFPDALAVSSYAAFNQIPILLVRKNEIPESTKKELEEEEVRSTIIIGGEEVISKEVASRLPKSTRIWGIDRFDTARNIAKEYFKNLSESGKVFVSTGDSFPDGLVSASLAAKIGPAPIILVKLNSVPAPTRDYFVENSLLIKNLLIIGGKGAISDNVKSILQAL